MFKIKYSTALYVFVALFFICGKIKAQDFADQGEGKIIVEEFLTLEQSPDLSKPYTSFTFYVKNYKVIRDDTPIIVPRSKKELDSLGNSTPFYDDLGNEAGTIKSSISVTVLKTKYILDLKTKTAFVIGYKNDKVYYYRSEMKDFRQDPYILFFDISKNADYKRVKFINDLNKNNAEKFCQEGLLVLNLKNEQKKPLEAILCLSKNKIQLKTPLDNLFNQDSPYSVLLATFPIEKNEQGIGGFYTTRVKEIKEQKISDEMFEIPSDAILLTQTEWVDISASFNTYKTTDN